MAIKGAIIGDISGSQYEFAQLEGLDYNSCDLFTDNCHFTDDTVMTLAAKISVKENISFANSYRKFGREYPDAGYGSRFWSWIWNDDDALSERFIQIQCREENCRLQERLQVGCILPGQCPSCN